MAALASQAERVDQELARLAARVYEMAGEEFNINSPKKLVGDPVRSARHAHRDDSADDEDQGTVHRVRGARGAGADARTAAGSCSSGVAPEAQGHLHRRAAEAGQPGNRPRAHLLQPGGRGHRPLEQQRSQPAEHPDPHRDRPRDPAGVRRRSRQRADLGRLLADRAARARAPRRRADARRRVQQGRRHSRSHGAQGLRRTQAASAPHELRRRAKIINYALLYGKQAFTLAKDIGVSRAGGAGSSSTPTSPASRGPRVSSTACSRSAPHGRRQDDVRPPSARAGSQQPQRPDPRPRRARRDEPADSGHRRRHPQAGDDRRPPRRCRPSPAAAPA